MLRPTIFHENGVSVGVGVVGGAGLGARTGGVAGTIGETGIGVPFSLIDH
jgi:hypothetical protein